MSEQARTVLQTSLEAIVARYLSQLDTADTHEPTEALAIKTTRLEKKLAKLQEEIGKLAAYEKQTLASPDEQISLTDFPCQAISIGANAQRG